MPLVLITGAAGTIGRVLLDQLRVEGVTFRSFDRVRPSGSDGDVVVGDLTDMAAVASAMDGVDCVIHLAGIPEEAAFADLIEDNIRGTYHVFEAAREAGVRRVVFASTNHVIGFHPTTETLDEHAAFRPDTLYGTSKVFGEALGALYHDKYGLEVISVRIGSFRQRPTTARELATWLSHGDAVRLFAACIAAPDVDHLVVYGVSANRRALWRDRAAETIGYRPQDDAEVFAASVEPPVEDDRFHGGAYTRPDHFGGF